MPECRFSWSTMSKYCEIPSCGETYSPETCYAIQNVSPMTREHRVTLDQIRYIKDNASLILEGSPASYILFGHVMQYGTVSDKMTFLEADILIADIFHKIKEVNSIASMRRRNALIQ